MTFPCSAFQLGTLLPGAQGLLDFLLPVNPTTVESCAYEYQLMTNKQIEKCGLQESKLYGWITF